MTVLLLHTLTSALATPETQTSTDALPAQESRSRIWYAPFVMPRFQLVDIPQESQRLNDQERTGSQNLRSVPAILARRFRNQAIVCSTTRQRRLRQYPGAFVQLLPVRNAGCQALVVGTLLLCIVSCGQEDPLAAIRELHARGRFAESLGPLRDLVDERPDDPELNRLYGVALVGTGQPSLAIWPLREAADDPERAVDAGLLLAVAYLQSGNADGAIAAAGQVLLREPDHVDALVLRAQAQLAARNEEGALADSERALALNPEHFEARVLRAGGLIGVGRLAEAEEALRTAAEDLSDPGLATPQRVASLCLARATFAKERGDLKRAEEGYEDCLEKFPADVAVAFAVAEFYDEVEQHERATEVLRAALEEAPRNFVLRTRAAHRLRVLGQVEDGERVLLEAVEKQPSLAASTTLAGYYVDIENYEKARSAYEQALAMSRQPGEALTSAYADVLILLGEYDRAQELAETLEEPVFVNLLRGRILLARGEPREALQALEAGIRFWPDNATARYLAAEAAEQLGDFDRAISEYRDAIRANPAYTDAGLQLATLLEAQARYEEALIALRYYTTSHPTDAEGFRVGVRLAQRLGHADLVNEAMSRLARLPDQAASAVAERAALAQAANGPEAAVQVVERSGLDLSEPRHSAAMRALVENLIGAGRSEEGLARVDAALEAHPDEAAFHEIRARALETSEGSREHARDAFERAIDLEPNRASALEGLARVVAEEGDLGGAIALYDRAAAADSEDPGPPYAAIELLGAAQKTDEVEQRLAALLTRQPRHARAANRLARRLLERGEELDRALELARRAVRFQAGPEAFDTLGWALLELGELDPAIAALKRAVAMRPDSPSSRNRLARALASR